MPRALRVARRQGIKVESDFLWSHALAGGNATSVVSVMVFAAKRRVSVDLRAVCAADHVFRTEEKLIEWIEGGMQPLGQEDILKPVARTASDVR